MSPVDRQFMWCGLPQDKLTDEQLAEAKGHVERTIATMLKSHEELRGLIPKYVPNMDIVNRFEEFLMAINDEVKIREELRQVG